MKPSQLPLQGRPAHAVAAWAAVLWLGLAGSPVAGEETVHRNRLAGETSPYLLQHAANPVDWYPWGPEAFDRARREDKPIFLSVGYSTCHWCHVMEEESFEDEEVAAVLNEHFICIKVDREERPDVDDLYMTAVQLMSGQGGWPMSVWMTPDRRPFFGRTYFPKPQFLSVLARIHEAWEDDRANLERQADRVVEALAGRLQAKASSRSLTGEPLETSVQQAAARFDSRKGGFGGAPKFPGETTLLHLLGRYERTGDAEALRMATFSLERMARGGIYDHVGGGFHRYSTDVDWLVPHFEKMLYNQAWLGRALLEAYRLTGRPLFLRTLRETLAYVLRDMTSPEGAFYTAEDADSEGEEGVFYVWTPAQVAEVLTGEGEAELFNAYYGVSPPGNFEEGTSILHVRQPLGEFAAARGQQPEDLRRRLDGMKERMLAARAKRPRPLRDDKVITGWNGMMIGTFARAGAVLDDGGYLAAADRAADFLLRELRDDKGNLLRVHRAGASRIAAFQEDYAYLVDGLLEIYRAGGDEARLSQARELADAMTAQFWDDEAGGFFATGGEHESLLVRNKEAYDGAVPSGNSVAAHDLARLARYTGDLGYREKAEQTLGAFAEEIERAPLAFTHMLVAADSLWNGEAGPRADDLRGVLTARLEPGTVRAAPGTEVPVELWLRLRPGWHVNSHRPGDDNLIPTALAVQGLGAPVSLQAADYPAGEEVELPFAARPMSIYRGEVRIPLRLALGEAATGPAVARVELRYQACDDEKCFAPETLPLELPLLPRESPPGG